MLHSEYQNTQKYKSTNIAFFLNSDYICTMIVCYDKFSEMISKTKKHFNTIVFSLYLLCIFPQINAQTYYVDAQTGNDDNSGLSSTEAWKTLRQVNITTFKPGDSILFHSGHVWEGMLFPRGSGEEGQPIVVSKYGGDEQPKIHGGHNDPIVFEGIRTIQTVLLHNQQYWVISDLEITNMPDNLINDFIDNGYEKRRGIFVVASDTGELRSITIKNNYIHHVKGDDTKDFHGSGGIMLSVLGKKKPSFFNGVSIINNRVYMVNRTGIGISSYWQRRSNDQAFSRSWIDEMGSFQANLNVVIRGNDLKSIGGDGIVPQTSFKPVIEYNKVDSAASRSEAYNVGLWAWNSDSALIQYNEVCNTMTVRDGMAFDCDAYSVGHICQYNFSHNNMGGFLLIHGYSDDVPDAMNIGHIIRYNISMNDGHRLIHFYGSGQTGSVIHNNLFYNENKAVVLIIVDGNPLDAQLTNNIFHIPEMAEWITSSTTLQISSNLAWLIFSDNFLLQKSIPENHEIEQTVQTDLYQLLNQQKFNEQLTETIHPEMLRLFWYNLVTNK